MYCTDHTLQLTAKQAYDDEIYNDEEDDIQHKTMKKLRSLVELFNSSTQMAEKLRKAQANMDSYAGKIIVGMLADVVTRWWSTFTMVDRALYLKPALAFLVADGTLDNGRFLTADEWQVTLEMRDVLEPFKVSQKALEGEKHVTISMIPISVTAICTALSRKAECNDVSQPVRKACAALLNDFKT